MPSEGRQMITHERLITLHIKSHGDPQYFDWDAILNLGPNESVELVKSEKA
jgi:hypothetical protein